MAAVKKNRVTKTHQVDFISDTTHDVQASARRGLPTDGDPARYPLRITTKGCVGFSRDELIELRDFINEVLSG